MLELFDKNGNKKKLAERNEWESIGSLSLNEVINYDASNIDLLLLNIWFTLNGTVFAISSIVPTFQFGSSKIRIMMGTMESVGYIDINNNSILFKTFQFGNQSITPKLNISALKL